jgi:hypothetical protein
MSVAIPLLPQYAFVVWYSKKKAQGQLYFTFASAPSCNCIAILWVSLVSFAAITLRVASQWIIPKLSVCFVVDSIRKLLDTPSYIPAPRTALEPTQPPIQWISGAFSLGVKLPGRASDHSRPSSAEVKECVELYLHSPIRLHSVVLS